MLTRICQNCNAENFHHGNECYDCHKPLHDFPEVASEAKPCKGVRISGGLGGSASDRTPDADSCAVGREKSEPQPDKKQLQAVATETRRKALNAIDDLVAAYESSGDIRAIPARKAWSMIYNDEAAALAGATASERLTPNVEVSDRRAHGNENTTGANGGSLH